MTQNQLNEILNFMDVKFQATVKIIESGQRIVYKSKSTENEGQEFVLKTCQILPLNVARVQREIDILKEINSQYFPRSIYSLTILQENLTNYRDNLDPRKDDEKIKEFDSQNLKPFLITIEDYIEHIQWIDLAEYFRKEENIINFTIELFSALNLLWEKKIVHRDLKPENILIRTNKSPVIIDLGIAKSFREGTQNLTHPLFTSPCTPQFASPEQLFNHKAEVTYKSDQFAIGVILFYTISSKFPYGNINEIGPEQFLSNLHLGTLTNLRNENTGKSERLILFIERLLNNQPYKRFRNYNEIINELNEIKGTK